MSTGLGLLAGTACGAEWRWQADVNLYSAWQQNPRLDPQEQTSDEQLGLGLFGTLKHDSGEASWLFESHLNARRYRVNDDLGTEDASLRSLYHHGGDRNQFDIELNGISNTTLTSELGNSGLTAGDLRHNSLELDASANFGLSDRATLGLSGSASTNEYVNGANSGLSNYRFVTLGAQQGWGVSEHSTVFVVLAADQLYSDANEFVQHDLSASLRLEHAGSEVWKWSAQLGGNRRTRAGQADTSVVASLGLKRAFERGAMSLDLVRSSAPLGNGLLTLRDTATLTGSHRFGDRLSGSLSLQGIRSEQLLNIYGMQLFTGSEWWNAAGTLDWALRPHVSLNAQASRALARRTLNEPWAHDALVRLGISWHPEG